jgi:xylulokinase
MDHGRFDRADAFLQPKDYLHLWLTGSTLTDPSSAARTLLFDQRSGAWWPGALDAFGLPEARLPRIVPSASAGATLNRRAATRLGLAVGTPVVVGAADRAAEAVGLGLSGPEAMISTGTATGIARVIASLERPDDDRITTPSHAMPGEALAMLSIPSTGATIEWLAGLVRSGRGDAVRSVMRLAAASEPGANGVLALPMFAGARSFRWQSNARGAFLGLGQESTAADLARALVEGITFEIAACVEVLEAAIGPIDRLLLTGGGYTYPFAAQLLCDVIGRPAVRGTERDAALVGAMLLARQAIGAADDPRADAEARASRSTTFRPAPEITEMYAPWARRYREAVDLAISIGSGPA